MDLRSPVMKLALFFILAMNLKGFDPAWADQASADSTNTAKEETSEKKGGLAIKDLPKPIPHMMEEIQRIGNEVGEGITKATGAGAEAIKKAIQDKPPTGETTSDKLGK